MKFVVFSLLIIRLSWLVLVDVGGYRCHVCVFFFFFQAEDGIRDRDG